MMNNIQRCYIAVLIALMLFPLSALAQKKEIASARANIKKGQNLEQAEKSMRDLLKDSTNLTNDKIWLTLFDAVKKQYDVLNEKLYLKQQSDTAKFFGNTIHMFQVLESLDTIDNMPNKEGKTEHIYRKRHASFLDQYRSNLYFGGLYFIKKQDYAKAYDFFDCYVDCAQQPLFTDFFYSKTDERLAEAAYWTMFCGYKMQDAEKIDRYVKIAVKDESREVYMLQYRAESCILKNDTACYRRTLEKGFAKYPDHAYFFPHLAIYYGKQGENEKVLETSDKVLFLDNTNVAAWVARSSAFYNMNRHDECVAASDRVIELGAEVPIVYANAGLSYYVQSIPYVEKVRPTREDKEKMRVIYKRALPYLEKYREMRPDDVDVWGKPLYNIYLNLNMGDKFEEIDILLNKDQ
ncbi:MAG: hypothetical protein Q4D33_05190 [Prevotellaceae bacterium]|nr:hypothetical protein [Prevotellaceae bacterium]